MSSKNSLLESSQIGKDQLLELATDHRRSSPWLNLLGLATLLILGVGLYGAFIYAPADVLQGAPQRIFYMHVPMAWVAYLAFFVVFVASIAYLATRRAKWDILARSSAEVGVVFTTLV